MVDIKEVLSKGFKDEINNFEMICFFSEENIVKGSRRKRHSAKF